MTTNNDDWKEADKRRTRSGGETAAERKGGNVGLEVGRSALATFYMFSNGQQRWCRELMGGYQWIHVTIRYGGGGRGGLWETLVSSGRGEI